jgi:hypothetical protein
LGVAAGGAGVAGFSGSDAGQRSAPPDTGVFGYASKESGAGVRGYSHAGTGVTGISDQGAGLSGSGGEYALRTYGRIRLDRSSGVATVPAGRVSAIVRPGIDLDTRSKVIATLQGNAGGRTTIHRVAIDRTTDTFTIFLTAKATAAASVAWLVLS